MPRNGRRLSHSGNVVLLTGLLSVTPVWAGPGGPAASTPSPSAAVPDLSPLTRASLMETVRWLAAPAMHGRLAGSPEYAQAGREAAERFRAWGLQPIHGLGAADSPADYLQELAVEYNRIETCALTLALPDGSTHALTLGTDHACRGLTGAGAVDAPIVFVGYGLSRPESGYDDYDGIDVRGKIALAFKEAPPFQVDSTGWQGVWMPRPKGMTATEHGAAALLIVPRPVQDYAQRPIGSMLEGDAPHHPDFPRLQISVPVAERILAAAGLDLSLLQAEIDSTRRPASRLLPVSARIDVRAQYDPERPSANVLAMLEGSDPARRDEVVVVGAHLDHVGSQGTVDYPGANDNASGAATVLGIARVLADAESRPRRSVLFALWTSEEAGLLGARHFVEHGPVARERIVAYLNFDCVGHGDSLEVGGGEEYPGYWGEARRLDAAGSGRMRSQTRGGGGADAEPFQEAGIPNLYFASHFSYTHLHQPTDRPETLNPELLEAIARIGAGLTWSIAEGNVEPGDAARSGEPGD